MAEISVVIASYNHEKYVRKTIESVLDQDYEDYEIVITDDGSSDNTVKEIRKINDSRIKLFAFKENRGACTAMRHCLENSSGRYIAVLNSDDLFLPGKLTKQVRFLDSHPDIGAVFGYARMINSDGNELTENQKKRWKTYSTIFEQQNRSRYEWLNHFFFKGNCLCHPSVLIRKECYEKVGFLDERYAQLPDFDFWIRLCMQYEIHIIAEPLICFRLHGNETNASGDTPEKMNRARWEYCQILYNYLRIDDLEVLMKIFSQAEKYDNNIDSDIIPYVLAMIALDIEPKMPIQNYFAIKILFNLLENRKTAEKLAKTFNFTYRDFYYLSGQLDLFGINEIKQLRERIKHPIRGIFGQYLKP